MSDLEKVKELRKATGAGFKDCNNALKESDGNLDKAVEILRVKGISKASKKMGREANEGLISVTGELNKTSIMEVNCETDFVGKNKDFISFVKELSLINHNISSDKNKLNSEIMKNGKTVDDVLVELISKIGEKITIGRRKTISLENCKNFIYQHGVVQDNLSKLAVISSIEMKDTNNNEINNFGKQLSMHIAASNPLAINQDDIEKSLIDKEKELIHEELKSSGKPDNIIEKISKGKLNKYIEENSLISQFWVMDPKKKVSEILKEYSEKNIKIKDFVRFKIGE